MTAPVEAVGGGAVTRARDGLVDAVAFLTVVPAGRVRSRDGFSLRDAVPWFPLIGAAVGALGGGLRAGLTPVLGAGPATVLAIIGMVCTTGGMHEDALADVCDGLGARGGGPERRLAAMRDSAVGAFGVLGLLGWGLLLFTALDRLSSAHAMDALLAAGALGRAAAPLHTLATRAARPDGLGAQFQPDITGTVVAVILAAAIAVAAVGWVSAAAALAGCIIVAALTAIAAARLFGGSTGDTAGASVTVAGLATVLIVSAIGI